MFLSSKPYDFDSVFRMLISLVWVVAIWYVLDYLSDVLIPFAIALMLAYFIYPLVEFYKSKVKYQGVAVVLSLLSFLLAMTAVVYFSSPFISNEFSQMGRLFKDLAGHSELARRAGERLSPDLWNQIHQWTQTEEFKSFLGSDKMTTALNWLSEKGMLGLLGVWNGATKFLMLLLLFFMISMYLFFILLDYPKIRDGWKDLIPDSIKQSLIEFLRDFDSAMSRYFRAQALVAAIVGILFAIGFSFIGLPLSIMLGLSIGLLNMIPYAQLIGLLPAALLSVVFALETGESFVYVLSWSASVFIIVQLIQDFILVPKIMGKITGLSPAIILLSLSIWGKLLGVLGLIIALPMTCLLLAYYQRGLLKYRKGYGQGVSSDA